MQRFIDRLQPRWRRIATRALCLLVVVNVGMCFMPDWPIARLSDAPDSSNDPALTTVLNLLRAIRAGNARAVNANVISDNGTGDERANLEWILLTHADVFTAATDASVFNGENDDAASSTRHYRVRMITPFGKAPIECTVQKLADQSWRVTELSPSADVPHQSSYSSGGTSEYELLSFDTPVPIALRNSLLARFGSDAFYKQAAADAGLTGIVGPSLIRHLWAVGFSRDNSELYISWSDDAWIPEPYVLARMGPHALRAALDCRVRAETMAALLAQPGLPMSKRFVLLYELFLTGDDEVTLPLLDRMAGMAQDEIYRHTFEKLAAYLRAHPASPGLVADASGYEHITDTGIFQGEQSAYVKGIVSTVAARLAARGIRTDTGSPGNLLHNLREKAFESIVPSIFRRDNDR